MNKADKALFTSSIVLIYYWVTKRHYPERVMKQFGLVQIVQPKFLRPLDRTKKGHSNAGNYKDKLKKVNDMWNRRFQSLKEILMTKAHTRTCTLNGTCV